MANIRVLVVDDHPVVRQGIKSLLSEYSNIEIVGEAGGDGEAVEAVAVLMPDIVLLDIRLAGQNGLDIAKQLQRSHARTKVIILTAHDDQAYLLQAAQAGVYGYLLKGASAEILADAICAVQSGERRISPGLADAAFSQLEVVSRKHARHESGLSELEFRLLELIADGASVHDIAAGLYQSERTVKRKTQEVLEKLGAVSRAQAVAEAFRRGLL